MLCRHNAKAQGMTAMDEIIENAARSIAPEHPVMGRDGGHSLPLLVGLPEDGKLPEIPDDIYDPVYSYTPCFKSPADSLCCGHWQWRKALLGFHGRRFGVMLHPDWEHALEY